MPRPYPRILASLLLCLLPLATSLAAAPEPESVPVESASLESPGAEAPPAVDSAQAAEDALTGDEIYRRVLENRFRAYEQRLEMESGDRTGHAQDVRLEMKYMSFKGQSETILSKTIAKYHSPQDVRHMGYLVVNKREGADDQFVYRPSSRRVRRVNLRGEAVFGTDFSFEDIIPQEFEDATYQRLPNDQVDDLDCFSVEVTPVKDAESEYSRFVVNVHKEHFIPLRTRYWDNRDVEVKLVTADVSTITSYDTEEEGEPKQVWIAQKSRVVNLKADSYTALTVVDLTPNPKLGSRDFSERKLTASR